jgi:hypothetical protein
LCCVLIEEVQKGIKGGLTVLFVLQPKPRRPDGLAPDKGWTAEDKTVGLVGWLTFWEAWKDPSRQAGGVVMVQTVVDVGGHF